MRSRFLSIKKSNWLIISAVLNLVIFLSLSIVCFVVLKLYNAWFFLFCINVGCHLILKGLLFKFDSSFYFGTVLLLVGALYFYSLGLDILHLYPVFILLSFSFASFITFLIFRQPFQLFLSLSLIFVTLGLLLFLLNLISVWIFLAITSASVLLFILKICLPI